LPQIRQKDGVKLGFETDLTLASGAFSTGWRRTGSRAALSGREWLFERTFSTENLADLRKALLKLAKKAPVQACYEASGAGFRLHRLLTDWGISCEVIAPSLIPTKPGEKKKCDRLDARKLAEYFDRGLLTKIHIPTAEEEADRNLIRCRFTLRRDVTRSKHRVEKFLDCQGHHYSGTAWTQAHRLWLEKQEFPTKPNSLAFRRYLDQLVPNTLFRGSEADRTGVGNQRSGAPNWIRRVDGQ